MKNENIKFLEECKSRIDSYPNTELQKVAKKFMEVSTKPKYSYNFTWMGRPIIQYPQDMIAVQELIWSIKPDLIIETGIAHGGSLIMSASLLAQLDMCEAIENGTSFNPKESNRKVLGIDIDIRTHNYNAILSHPMSTRIQMIQGSSISDDVISKVKEIAVNYECVLIFLDSNHTHDHVKAELDAYGMLTTKGSYCVVFDTIIDSLPSDTYPDRTWGPNNNPMTAIREYLESHSEFEIDVDIDRKLLISVSPNGYLKRVK